jgi:hypothetical protein
MNLTKAYMERLIWSNVLDMSVYTRVKKETPPQINFTFLLGAPEVISPDRKFALTIHFKNCLSPELILSFLYLEYNYTHFKYKHVLVSIYDAAILYTHVDECNHLIIEMNAVKVDIKKAV